MFVVADHRVQNREQFVGTGDERDLLRLPGGVEALVDDVHLRVPAPAAFRQVDPTQSSQGMQERMNKAWHERHRMPKNATLAERTRWHLAHAKHCGCRPIPRTVLAALRAQGPAAAGSKR